MRARSAWVAVVLAGVVLPLTALTSPASSTTSRATAPSAVTGARFPSTASVARIFPAYRGGVRYVFRSRGLDVLGEDCVSVDTARTRARAGATAGYNGRGLLVPYFEGGTAVSVSVDGFRDPGQARAAFDELRASVERCYGRHTLDGREVSQSPLRAPRIGQESFAYRFWSEDPTSGRDWFVCAAVRRGAYVALTTLQRDLRAPSARQAFALARVEARALR